MNRRTMMVVVSCFSVAAAFGAEHDTPPAGFPLNDWQKQYMPEPLEKRAKRIEPVKEGELRLVPTFLNCSVVWGAAAPVEGLAVEYRRRGGSAWTAAEKPLYFKDVKNYRSSVLGLEEDTPYEVRLVAGGKTLASGGIRTWKSEVKIGRTVVVDPKTAKYPIEISDQGRPEAWVRYTVKPGTVLGGRDLMTSVFAIRHAKYVTIDDVVIVGGGGGGGRNPIYITDSHAIRVRNCELSGWGRIGEPVYTARGRGVSCADREGKERFNWDAAIMIDPKTTEIVVERCYIHDARNRSNSWYYSHPSGTEGIFLNRCGHGIVLRWNDIVGSDFHRFNDCIETCENFQADGGFNRDSDVYGNFAIFANDDNIELDGGMQNVRCFKNRFEAAVSQISIQGCCASPVYVYDNLLAGGRDEFGAHFDCIKTSTFNPWWYEPYAMIAGNWQHEASFRPTLGTWARWDCRDDNVVTTNEIPRAWATKLPSRNLPFVLDAGLFRGIEVAEKPVSVKFRAIAKARQAYRVRKNLDADWFEVSPSEGVLKPGETEFTVTFRPERMKSRRHWRAAFLVRTPEGLSRCVSVYADNVLFRAAERPVPPSARTIYAENLKPDGGEIAFDVTEEGDYHFFLKGSPAGDSVYPRVMVSLDGGNEDDAIMWLEKTHEVWTMIRPGNKGTCGNPRFLDPFHLTPGRHVFKVSPLPCRPKARLSAAAISDHAYEFEAH